jgi:hypothetical protein
MRSKYPPADPEHTYSPPSQEQNPQKPVGALEAQTGRRVLLENGELVTKREDLRSQGSAG